MEKDKSIKVYTFIFIFILIGFIGFLIYQGQEDAYRKGDGKPAERSKYIK